MKLIVYSSADKFHSETDPVTEMFEEGLEIFHLRKPKFTSKELSEYLDLIPKKYHNRIVLHTHHKLAKKYKLKGVHITRAHRKKKYSSNFKLRLLRLKHPTWCISRSCHRIQSLNDLSFGYNYVMLSPLYDNISLTTHAGIFSKRGLKSTLEKKNIEVIAMGGVDESKFKELIELGFSGVALLGAIWNGESSPVETFLSAKNKLEELILTSDRNFSF